MAFSFEDLRFPAADHFALGATCYTPASPSAAVVLAGATAVRRRFYDRFCRYLADAGMAAVCFDYRGLGDSRPRSLRGFPARMQDWGELDLEGALTFARARWPSLPLGLVGHSAGGQVVGLAPSAGALEALLFVGSQSGDWRLWPLKWKPRMLGLWYLGLPAVSHALGYVPGALGMGGDLPKGVALQWARWGRRVGYLAGGEDSGRKAAYAKLRVPLRALSFEDDWYAPRRAVEGLLALYAGAEVEHVHRTPGVDGFPALGHFGFFRSEHRALWDESLAWLREKLG